jgi:hypothetical protein
MTTFTLRRNNPDTLNELIASAPHEPASLTDDHRRSLSARFRAIATLEHRRLDAWSVERAGTTQGDFRWSPSTARRLLGTAALRRVVRQPGLTPVEAVHDEIIDQLLRVTSGYAQRGSMAHWLTSLAPSEVALVSAAASNWATDVHELAEGLDAEWRVCQSDAYYDVARARTTLRAHRDLEVSSEEGRVVLRVRSGAPGKSSGPGLRSELTIEALAHPQGVAPRRFIGVWPDAGVLLGVDGTMADLRAGARDLVRTAMVQHRHVSPRRHQIVA